MLISFVRISFGQCKGLVGLKQPAKVQRVLDLLLCTLHSGRRTQFRSQEIVVASRLCVCVCVGSPSSLLSSSWLLRWYWREMLSCNEKRVEKTLCDSPGCLCHKPVVVSLFVLLMLLLLLLLLLVVLLLLLLAAALSFFGGERGRSFC